MFKSFIIILSLFYYSSSAILLMDSEQEIKETYASLDYQEGDIVLTILSDRSFLLEIKKFDRSTMQHSEIKELVGTWEIKNKILTLTTDKGITIEYQESKSEMSIGDKKITPKSYVWISSSVKTETDGIELINKAETDKFFLESMMKKE